MSAQQDRYLSLRAASVSVISASMRSGLPIGEAI
jgi:hypothetical protein